MTDGPSFWPPVPETPPWPSVHEFKFDTLVSLIRLSIPPGYINRVHFADYAKLICDYYDMLAYGDNFRVIHRTLEELGIIVETYENHPETDIYIEVCGPRI